MTQETNKPGVNKSGSNKTSPNKTDPNKIESYIKLGRWLTLLGYFSLFFGLFAWHLLIEPAAKHLISIIILLQIGPLMFPLMGLLRGKLYTHAWSMYVAIFYFIIGVWYAGSSEDLLIGLYVIFTSLTFFLGTVLYTRYMGIHMKAQSTNN